jgi:hypothetical protein
MILKTGDNMFETQIIIGKCNHKGNEHECYIPQIKLNGAWKNILSGGSYILKETYDPVVLCKKCDGQGCQQCQNRGFIKGERADLIHVAEGLLRKEVELLESAFKLTEKYR